VPSETGERAARLDRRNRWRRPLSASRKSRWGKQARTDVYGYLLATVHPNGEIQFVFKEIKPANIPAQTVERYGTKQVQACFDENKSTCAPEGPSCTVSTAGGN
jgi:hypothetical protein